jgi:transcriptional regulator with XRE-family HTH domain
MGKSRSTAEETEKELERSTAAKSERPSPAEQRAVERKVKGAQVRKRYDFTVIRKLRHEKGLTIEQFAKACGLSYAPVSRIETNLIKPNLDTLDKIAEGLGISTHSLIALAERREVEQERAREILSGGMTFEVASAEGIDVSTCVAKRGQVSGEFELRTEGAFTVAVASGKVQLTINEKVRELGPGDVVRFEASFVHRYAALEDSTFVLVKHPRR